MVVIMIVVVMLIMFKACLFVHLACCAAGAPLSWTGRQMFYPNGMQAAPKLIKSTLVNTRSIVGGCFIERVKNRIEGIAAGLCRLLRYGRRLQRSDRSWNWIGKDHDSAPSLGCGGSGLLQQVEEINLGGMRHFFSVSECLVLPRKLWSVVVVVIDALHHMIG